MRKRAAGISGFLSTATTFLVAGCLAGFQPWRRLTQVLGFDVLLKATL
jgi:hypothetical protein